MKTITKPVEKTKCILVTGATGYVGWKLAKALICCPYRLRCLVRDPIKLKRITALKPWTDISDSLIVSGTACSREWKPKKLPTS